MAASSLPANYECGYCISRKEFIRDPRELPCLHAFCLSCIQEHYKKHRSVTCPTCKKVHKSLNVDSLAKVAAREELFCTANKCQGQIARCYCVTCGDKLCSRHQETHQSHFGNSHKEVDIDIYQKAPTQYSRPVCPQHEDVLVRACVTCDKLVCFECEIDASDCTGLKSHNFKSLTSLKAQVNSYLESQIKSVAQKKMEVLEQDKKIWRDLDIQEQKCGDILKEIIRVKNIQIKTIEEESQSLIQQITDHKAKVTSQVEYHYNQLMMKKDNLEKLTVEVQTLLNNGHITEMIKQKKGLAERIEIIEKQGPEQILIDNTPSLVENLDPQSCKTDSQLNIRLMALPSKLKPLSEHEIDGFCYSANHRQEGDILIATHFGIQLLDRNYQMVTRKMTDKVVVTTAVEHNGDIYFLQKDANRCKIEMCLNGCFTKREELLSFEQTGVADMAVSNKYIAFNNSDSKELIIFDLQTKQKESFILSVFPRSLQFLSDSHLLALGEGKLIKYKLENGALTSVWQCDKLRSGNKLCTDSDELIYVSTRNNRRAIYIISPGGNLLATLIHDDLPKTGGVPSIKDGIIALPGWSDRKLHVFKIEK